MGIKLEPLLCSKIYEYSFEYPEWASVHPNSEDAAAPYNGSIFTLRHHYKEVFPEYAEEKQTKNDQQMFKIVYKVNLIGTIQPKGETTIIE